MIKIWIAYIWNLYEIFMSRSNPILALLPLGIGMRLAERREAFCGAGVSPAFF